MFIFVVNSNNTGCNTNNIMELYGNNELTSHLNKPQALLT